MSNAAKFTERGYIHVSVEMRGLSLLSVVVSDSGPGLSDQERQEVFSLYKRTTSASSIEGTGVGLHVVKKLTVAMGGDAYVENNPDGDTIFTAQIGLPVRAYAETEGVYRSCQVPPLTPLLCLDSEDKYCQSLIPIARALGWQVFTSLESFNGSTQALNDHPSTASPKPERGLILLGDNAAASFLEDNSRASERIINDDEVLTMFTNPEPTAAREQSYPDIATVTRPVSIAELLKLMAARVKGHSSLNTQDQSPQAPAAMGLRACG